MKKSSNEKPSIFKHIIKLISVLKVKTEIRKIIINNISFLLKNNKKDAKNIPQLYNSFFEPNFKYLEKGNKKNNFH